MNARDIRALIETERKYRELVTHANSIIMRITPDHRITFFNEYAQRFFGYREDEVLGRSVLDCIVPRVDSEGRDHVEMTRQITAAPEHYADNENENICKDGKRVWVHWSNRAIRDEHGALQEILCIGVDVTEKKRMQQMNARYQKRLQRLAHRLVETEEQKRWQISRFVHDKVIQNLSLSSMRLAGLRRAMVRNHPEHAETLQTIRELVDESIGRCRTVMSDLTPALLYELGLVPALREMAETLGEKYGTRIEIAAEDELDHDMDNALRGFLFQACRELVMNALKHGGRCVVRVMVTRSGKTSAFVFGTTARASIRTVWPMTTTIMTADSGCSTSLNESKTWADASTSNRLPARGRTPRSTRPQGRTAFTQGLVWTKLPGNRPLPRKKTGRGTCLPRFAWRRHLSRRPSPEARCLEGAL